MSHDNGTCSLPIESLVMVTTYISYTVRSFNPLSVYTFSQLSQMMTRMIIILKLESTLGKGFH